MLVMVSVNIFSAVTSVRNNQNLKSVATKEAPDVAVGEKGRCQMFSIQL